MVGQGVLQECLASPEVENVLSIGRGLSGKSHPKLREIAHQDFTDFSAIEGGLLGYDACFFCLGVSSIGMTEVAYRRVTYEFTLAAARTLARLNPQMTFIYVGTRTDSSASSSAMCWVKGETENDSSIAVPCCCIHCLHQPLNGIVPKRLPFYGVVAPHPVWEAPAEVPYYHSRLAAR